MKLKILLSITIMLLSLPTYSDPGDPFSAPGEPLFWVCTYSHSEMANGQVIGNNMVVYDERTVYGFGCPPPPEPDFGDGHEHITVNFTEVSYNGTWYEGHTLNDIDCRIRLNAQPFSQLP